MTVARTMSRVDRRASDHVETRHAELEGAVVRRVRREQLGQAGQALRVRLLVVTPGCVGRDVRAGQPQARPARRGWRVAPVVDHGWHCAPSCSNSSAPVVRGAARQLLTASSTPRRSFARSSENLACSSDVGAGLPAGGRRRGVRPCSRPGLVPSVRRIRQDFHGKPATWSAGTDFPRMERRRGPTVEPMERWPADAAAPASRRRHVETSAILGVVRSAVLVGVTLASVLAMPVGATAQALTDVQTPDTPLVLKAQGSFFVGGEKVGTDARWSWATSVPAATSPSTRCTCGTWCRRAGTATCRW